MERLRNLCRACLEHPGEISIFHFKNTITKLRCCTPITKIEKNNGLPESLCKKCAQNLNDAYKFYTKCGKSNNHLLGVLVRENLAVGQEQLNYEVKIEVEVPDDRTPKLDFNDEIEPEVTCSNNERRKQTFEQTNWVEGYSIQTEENTLECQIQEDVTQDTNVKEEPKQANDYNCEDVKDIEECEMQTNVTVDTNEAQCKEHETRVVEAAKNNFKIVEMGVKCKMCKQPLFSCDYFLIHMTERHPNEPSNAVECEYCSRKFTTWKTVRCHILRKHATRSHRCAFCCQEFALVEDKNKHERFHEKEKINDKAHTTTKHSIKTQNSICDYCGESCTNKFLLRCHILGKHMKEKSYKCASCDKMFAINAERRKHERVHEREGQMNTDFIKKKLKSNKGAVNVDYSKGKVIDEGFDNYEDSESEDEHLNENEHTNDTDEHKELNCCICPFTCIDKEQLKLHVDVHTDETYFCDICKKDFKGMMRINRHKRSHKKQPPRNVKYPCEICAAPVSAAYMIGHIKSIHEFNEVKCTICNKVVRNPFALEQHTKKCHNPKPNVKKWHCDYCGIMCTTKAGLGHHIDRTHTKIRRHKCPFCGQPFATIQDMRLHERLHTGERPHQCPLCDKSYAQLCNMKSHFKHNHREHNYKEAMAEFKEFIRKQNLVSI